MGIYIVIFCVGLLAGAALVLLYFLSGVDDAGDEDVVNGRQ